MISNKWDSSDTAPFFPVPFLSFFPFWTNTLFCFNIRFDAEIFFEHFFCKDSSWVESGMCPHIV